MSDSAPTPTPKFNLKGLTSRKIMGIPVLYLALIVAAVSLYIALRMKRTPDEEVPADESGDKEDDSLTETDEEIDTPVFENPVFEANPIGSGGTVTVGGSQPLPPVTPSPNPPPGDAATPKRGRKQGFPPCWHTVENKADDTPRELALLYYGKNNGDYIAKLQAQNLKLGPSPWAKGTRVWIPPEKEPQYFKATATVRNVTEIAAKNGVDGGAREIRALNPGMAFPVAVGTRVRIS